MASARVATLDTCSPAGGSGADRGTTARSKPSRAASARRRAMWPTWRSSPPRPTSPQATTSVSYFLTAGETKGIFLPHAV